MLRKRRAEFVPYEPWVYTKLQNIFARVTRCYLCGHTLYRRFKKQGFWFGNDTMVYFVCANSENARPCKFWSVPYEPIEQLFLENAPDLLPKYLAQLKSDVAKGKTEATYAAQMAEARVNEVLRLIKTPKFDRWRVNRQLRNLLGYLSIDNSKYLVHIGWQTGGSVSLSYEKAVRNYFDSFLKL